MRTTTIDEIMNWYYNLIDFKKLISKHTESTFLCEEAYQEIGLIILEYNRDKIINMWNKNELKYFIIRIIKNTLYSTTSPFYKKIKKFGSITSDIDEFYNIKYTEDEEEIEPAFITLKNINNHLNDKEMKSTQDYHDVQLFKMYKYQNMTYRQIQDKTLIHYSYVYTSVKRIEAEIVKKFKK